MHTKIQPKKLKISCLSGFCKNYLIWVFSLVGTIIFTILGVAIFIAMMSYKTIALYKLSNEKIIESAGATAVINVNILELEDVRIVLDLKNKELKMPDRFRNVFFYNAYSNTQSYIVEKNTSITAVFVTSSKNDMSSDI